ncbi:MAG: hypothetical protein FJ083_12520 [Cyanobacteria bacterium K_Offshore_surface_m2_239]|nr:hypothetical protein [Cyanobacteria bacterium K_Offshore_surface_m2_239]
MSVGPKWRAVLHILDKNCRHRGSDERDSPLLGEGEGAAGEEDVVKGGEQGDQAKEEAAGGLKQAKPIEARAGELRQRRVWRKRRWFALIGWRGRRSCRG